MITYARYSTPDYIAIAATLDTGAIINLPSYPSHTHYDAQMEEYLLTGIIEPYDEFYGQSDDDIKETRMQDNQTHATRLSVEAELNPEQGVFMNERQAKNNKTRRDTGAKHKNNKNKKVDDDLIDYQWNVAIELDDADDQVAALTTRQEIIDWIPNNASWSVWVAPTP